MQELVWLNGEILPLSEARIGVEDRGFQFADGVYEVIRIYNGRPFAMPQHFDRLERSCGGINLAMPLAKPDLTREISQFLQRTGVREGMIYLQITRGQSPRNHVSSPCKPTLLFYTRDLPPMLAPAATPGLKLISVPDERWQRCWIKSIALLPNILAKNQAVAAGADEAVFIHDGVVTECCASNIFILRRGQLLTHPVGPKVLPGITRLILLDLADQLGIPAIERPIFEAEAFAADELFITSTTREVAWVSRWNNQVVGNGNPGPLTLKLHHAIQEKIRKETTGT
jgi:D-alanine transaminase